MNSSCHAYTTQILIKYIVKEICMDVMPSPELSSVRLNFLVCFFRKINRLMAHFVGLVFSDSSEPEKKNISIKIGRQRGSFRLKGWTLRIFKEIKISFDFKFFGEFF